VIKVQQELERDCIALQLFELIQQRRTAPRRLFETLEYRAAHVDNVLCGHGAGITQRLQHRC
jgi:hypothetical protein